MNGAKDAFIRNMKYDKMKYSREARLWSPKEAHWCRYLPTGQQVAKPSENISQTNKSLFGWRQAADEKSKIILSESTEHLLSTNINMFSRRG